MINLNKAMMYQMKDNAKTSAIVIVVLMAINCILGILEFLFEQPIDLSIEFTVSSMMIFFMIGLGAAYSVIHFRMLNQVGLTRRNYYFSELISSFFMAIGLTLVLSLIEVIFSDLRIGTVHFTVSEHWDFTIQSIMSLILLYFSMKLIGNIIGIFLNKFRSKGVVIGISVAIYFLFVIGAGVLAYLVTGVSDSVVLNSLIKLMQWLYPILNWLGNHPLTCQSIFAFILMGVYYLCIRRHESKTIEK